MLILNIGLVTSENHFEGGVLLQKAGITSAMALVNLVDHGFKVHWHKVAQSATEQTLIVGVQSDYGMHDSLRFRLNKLSNILQQDCIAAFDAINGKGYLIGDYAEDWGGEFNPEYFIIG